jgi:tRNA(Met) cytidine acetyltransferase
LVADRGRGKSAALGIAAARLLQSHQNPGAAALHIVVTAPRLEAAQAVFSLARTLLPEAEHHSGAVYYGESSLRYVAPDVLCLEGPEADLVLVDEAAAIPASLLQQLLQRYARIVFATTTHGYEGTGRGFAVRFRQTLDEQTPGWQELRLHSPIRWAEGDPLERLVFDALLLDANCAADEAVAAASLDTVDISTVSRDELLQDDSLLTQLFGLLVVAHYRTTPYDLRNLLDGPAISVYVMCHQQQVVATALVSSEGNFDAATATAIYAGRRRPRGHLLAQSLVCHLGLEQAAALSMARVMRIAVHPRLQGQGLGSALLEFIRRDAQTKGHVLLGTSFGASPALLRFWQRQQLWPVRVGFRRDHASGEHSLLMLAPLQAEGEAVFAAARARWHRDLPCWLSDPLRELDSAVVAELMTSDNAAIETAFTADDRRWAQDFATGARSFEDSLGPLWRLAQHAQHQLHVLPEPQRTLFIAKLWQRRSWSTLARLAGLAGRAAVLAQLRQAVTQLLPLQKN